MSTKLLSGTEHTAMARGLNLPISTKQSVHISKCLRYKTTSYAAQFLQEVMDLQRAVPFKTSNKDMGHKPGMAAGRYPLKAAKEFLRLVKTVEANAQVKGLDTANLKITKMVANKASVSSTGGRQRHAKKRTHLEIVVMEQVKNKEKKDRAPGEKAKNTEVKTDSNEIGKKKIESHSLQKQGEAST